jgi:hypothetical protein
MRAATPRYERNISGLKDDDNARFRLLLAALANSDWPGFELT